MRINKKKFIYLISPNKIYKSFYQDLTKVLQEKKVTPVGGQRDIDVDVRVLATSNRDMVSEVKQSRFREDLYYRLNVFRLQTKNLSERKDDIIPISLKILEKHCKKDFIPVISETAKEILLNQLLVKRTI